MIFIYAFLQASNDISLILQRLNFQKLIDNFYEFIFIVFFAHFIASNFFFFFKFCVSLILFEYSTFHTNRSVILDMADFHEVTWIVNSARIQTLIVYAGQLRETVIMCFAFGIWWNECILEAQNNSCPRE